MNRVEEFFEKAIELNPVYENKSIIN